MHWRGLVCRDESGHQQAGWRREALLHQRRLRFHAQPPRRSCVKLFGTDTLSWGFFFFALKVFKLKKLLLRRKKKLAQMVFLHLFPSPPLPRASSHPETPKSTEPAAGMRPGAQEGAARALARAALLGWGLGGGEETEAGPGQRDAAAGEGGHCTLRPQPDLVLPLGISLDALSALPSPQSLPPGSLLRLPGPKLGELGAGPCGSRPSRRSRALPAPGELSPPPPLPPCSSPACLPSSLSPFLFLLALPVLSFSCCFLPLPLFLSNRPFL